MKTALLTRRGLIATTATSALAGVASPATARTKGGNLETEAVWLDGAPPLRHEGVT